MWRCQRQNRVRLAFIAFSWHLTSPPLLLGTPLLKIFQNQTSLQEHSIVCAFLLSVMGVGSFNLRTCSSNYAGQNKTRSNRLIWLLTACVPAALVRCLSDYPNQRKSKIKHADQHPARYLHALLQKKCSKCSQTPFSPWYD